MYFKPLPFYSLFTDKRTCFERRYSLSLPNISGDHDGRKVWTIVCLRFRLRCEFLSFDLCTMAAESKDSDVTEKNDEIANGVNRQKQNDDLLVQKTLRKGKSDKTQTWVRKTMREGFRSNGHRKYDWVVVGSPWRRTRNFRGAVRLLCRSRRRHWEKRNF